MDKRTDVEKRLGVGRPQPWWELRMGGTFSEEDVEQLRSDASVVYTAVLAWAERGNCAFARGPRAECACDWHMAKAAVRVMEKRS